MKIYCQYSGINYQTTYGNFIDEQTYVHPIFTVPATTLLKQRMNWFAGRIESELDRRLLFLALLHSTEQVEFHSAAKPSDKVVQTNFPRLFDSVDWIVRLKVPGLVLPRFRITKESESLDNVRYWLECWQGERERFEDGYRNYERDKKNLERERILERNIKNPTKRAQQYAGLLATWALEASDAPEDKRKYWRELFLLKEPALFSANPDHIQELYEWLEVELEAGSIYSFKALWYVQTLLKKVRAGWSAILGFDDEEAAQSSVFAIDDDLQRANTLAIISKAPATLPVRTAYATESAFLRAKIAWDMKEQLIKETAAATKAAELHREAVAETTARIDSATILHGVNDGTI